MDFPMDFPWIPHAASEERPPLVLPVPLVLVSRDTVQDQREPNANVNDESDGEPGEVHRRLSAW